MTRSEFEDKIKIETNYKQPVKADAGFGKSKKFALASAFMLLAIAFGVNQWFGVVNFAKGANCISAGSGNWSTITWTNCTGNPGGVPAAGDTVTITAGHTVTLDQDATIAGLTIDVTSSSTSLIHSGTFALTVNGTVTMNQPNTNGISSNWNINAGTATVTGLVTMAGSTTTTPRTVNINITTGTLNLDGGLSVAAAASNKVIDMTGGAGTINFKGAWTTGNNLTLNSGTAGATFNYNGTSAQTINTTFVSGGYHNLTISNSNVNGATQSGTINTTNLTGNLTVATGGVFKQAGTITGTSGKTFSLVGTGIHEMTSGAYPTGFTTFTMSSTSTTRYYQSGPTIAAGTYGHLDIKNAYLATATFAAGTVNVQGDLTLQSAFNVTYIYADTNDPIINVTGNVIIGTLTQFYASSSSLMTIGGNLNLEGNFIHQNGSVEFNNSSLTSVLSGSGTFTFYNFIVNTPGKVIQLAQTKTFRFVNNFTVTGASGNNVVMNSTVNGNQWVADFDIAQTDFNINYLSVRDSGCDAGSLSRTAINSTNQGNNGVCWSFLNSTTVSGNVYDTKANAVWSGAGKCDGSTQSIALSINGGAPQTTTCDSGTGAFSFSVSPDSDAIIAIWMNTSGGDKGAIYTRSGLGNITGLKLYKNQTLIRHELGSSITNADINTYDNSNDSDIPLASDGTAVVASSGTQITVVASMNYAPGGNVTTPALEVAGTYTGASETLTITGSGSNNSCTTEPGTMIPICVVSGGIFSPGTNTTDFTTTSATAIPGIDFYNVRFVPTSGSPVYTLGASNYRSLTANNVTIGNGTNVVTLNGGLTGFSVYTQTITVSTNADYNLGDSKLALQSASTPITVNGTIDYDTSTIVFNSAANFTIPDLPYYNLQLAPNGSNGIHTFSSGTYDIDGNLTIGNEGGGGGIIDAASNNPTINVVGNILINETAKFNASSANMTVNGNWHNFGEFIGGSGTVTLSSASTGKQVGGFLSGSYGKFNNLTLTGGGEWTVSGDIVVDGDLTVSSGSFVGAGSLTVNGGDITGNGTVMFAGNNNLNNVSQLASGLYNHCAIDIHTDLWCWGAASYGQLGDGQNSTHRYSPVRVLKGAATGADADGAYITNIKHVVGGYYYNCALSYSGNTYCWGAAEYGKLGDGQTTTDRTTPVKVMAGAAYGGDTDGTYLTNIKSLGLGFYNTCAVSNAGNTYCWGRGSYGQLGDGQTGSDRSTPVKVLKGAAAVGDHDGTFLSNIKSIDLGFYHSCAITNLGNSYCWGTASSGQLGDGQTSTLRTTPVRVLKGAATGSDTDGTYLTNVTQISTDSSVSCAVSGTKKLYCWGEASPGQIGDGQTAANRSSPVRVLKGAATGNDTDGTYLINVRQSEVGGRQNCAITFSNILYCWGTNEGGAMGSASSSSSPVRVVKGLATAEDNDGTYFTNTKEVTTAYNSTCAYSFSKNLYCWGSSGYIGSYSANSTNASPLRVLTQSTQFTHITGADRFACGTTTGSGVYCWGFGGAENLGDGTVTNKSYAIRVLKGAATGSDTDGTYLTNVRQVSNTSWFSCALTYSGNVYCWGYASSGRLGDGFDVNRSTPVRVVKGAAILGDSDGAYLTNIRAISNGSQHVCSLANSGYMYCWGGATSGVLGNGVTTPSQNSPVRVLKGVATGDDTDGTYLANIKQIAVGSTHSCAISNLGNTYCWGESDTGQLGDGQSSTDRTTPVKVVKGPDAVGADTDGTYLINLKQLTASGSATCGITNTDKAFCWGAGSNGQIGNNASSAYSSPRRVLAGQATGTDSEGTYLRNLRRISSGGTHTCAVTKSNKAYCWGAGMALGVNDSANKLTPVRILAGRATDVDNDSGYLGNVWNIDSGDGTQFGGNSDRITCAASFTGRAYCTGSNEYGVITNIGPTYSYVMESIVEPVSNLQAYTTTLNGTGNFGGNSNWSFVDLKLGTTTPGTTTATGSGAITIQGSFTNAASHTLNAGSKTYTIGDDFTNSGTFTGNTSTVLFNNLQNTATLAGAGTTNFNNLSVTTPGKYLQFTSGHTFQVSGALVVTGSAGDKVNITSTTGNSVWYINHQGTESVSYADIAWSGCYSGSTIIDLTNGTNTDSGNNSSCWRFVPFTDRSGGSGPTDGGAGTGGSSGTGDGGDGGEGSTDGGSGSGGSSGSGNGGGGGGSISP